MTLLRYPSDLLRGAGGLLHRGIDAVGGGLLRGAQAVGSVMGGVDPSVQDPSFDPRMAMSNALMGAGNAMVQAGGGPTRWGEMRGSPLSAVMAGLAAGRESYQTAQQGGRDAQRRRSRYSGLMEGVDQRTGLLRVYQRAIEEGDVNEARTAATMFSALGSQGMEDPALAAAELDAVRALAEQRRGAAEASRRPPQPRASARSSTAASPVDREVERIRAAAQRFMYTTDLDSGARVAVPGMTWERARDQALQAFPDVSSEARRRLGGTARTPQQQAWDALPGTPEQKVARVGPRP